MTNTKHKSIKGGKMPVKDEHLESIQQSIRELEDEARIEEEEELDILARCTERLRDPNDGFPQPEISNEDLTRLCHILYSDRFHDNIGGEHIVSFVSSLRETVRIVHEQYPDEDLRFIFVNSIRNLLTQFEQNFNPEHTTITEH